MGVILVFRARPREFAKSGRSSESPPSSSFREYRLGCTVAMFLMASAGLCSLLRAWGIRFFRFFWGRRGGNELFRLEVLARDAVTESSFPHPPDTPSDTPARRCTPTPIPRIKQTPSAGKTFVPPHCDSDLSASLSAHGP